MRVKSPKEIEKTKKNGAKQPEISNKSKPNTRRRIDLIKQKHEYKIIGMENDQKYLDETRKLFDEEGGKFITQELKKLSHNSKNFDSVKILKQLDQVNSVIKEL